MMTGSDFAQLFTAMLGLIGTFGGIWYSNRLQTQSTMAMRQSAQTNPTYQQPLGNQPFSATPSLETPTGLNKGNVLRDIGILVTIGALVGFLVGLISPDFESALLTLGVVNIFIYTIGFTIIGVKSNNPRWLHLFAVAMGVWLIGIVNFIFLPGFTMADWLISLVVIMIFMGIGGALSSLIKR